MRSVRSLSARAAMFQARSRKLQQAIGARPSAIEALEERRLLTTLIVTGTSSNDTWAIDASASGIFVNGVQQNSSGVDSIQVNGLDGNDLLIINQCSSAYQIGFNGGNNDDSLRLSNIQSTSTRSPPARRRSPSTPAPAVITATYC
jgi:hypothetical protein